ncbi:hypothetical protein FDT66_08045 [Polaribacter aestuariivivens]|uniref:Bacteriophage abortive infection AbiH n=1 Tax=Polaribacter aestuariivivens TaxID=2304626 RepID=A0A5S3N3D9_9FLAO|nr:AbiH family protein [Polaribacter aestuariivivens]TMM29815.1 hypothetical protein FDT66_08045 [Polaribacter aestuariivivens]
MNKLILVGNGFDLAHGLPTSYKDFINDIWKNLEKNYLEIEYSKVFEIDNDLIHLLSTKKIENFSDFNILMNEISYANDISYNKDILFIEDKFHRKTLLKVKNDFFVLINNKNSIENWVDIENEYYLQLKKIVKLKFGNFDENQTKKTRKEKILKLNNEFEEVKNLLIKYLDNKVLKKFDVEKIATKEEFIKIYDIFKPNSSLNNNKWDDREFTLEKDVEHINKIYKEEELSKNVYCESYIANFNYTDSSCFYNLVTYQNISYRNTNINSIHGEVNSEHFKPVFGFGDEMDEDYQLIENIDDNEYLKFFKSFQYFQNTAYNNLLRQIDSIKYQVIVLGHSCGLSDRVLLNTIFEHENCRSIKIYYHQREDGSDNYLDIVKNISRHFKDKSSMRRKIVSKELSSPLPQNVRFQKK